MPTPKKIIEHSVIPVFLSVIRYIYITVKKGLRLLLYYVIVLYHMYIVSLIIFL